jgi:glycosyltransferase involved in cell wall biosynthesis
MKILHINTNDKGGAATACIRIHLGLLERGIDSKILFLNRTNKDIPQCYQFHKKITLVNRLVNRLEKVAFKYRKSIKEKYPEVEWFTNPNSPYDITEHPLYKEADIIQLNWVSGFLDEPGFFKKNIKPVIWRMADLYTCGGGYHYEKGFPFGELGKVLQRNAAIRKKSLAQANVTFVAISEWVRQKAKESELIGSFPLSIIHNGLDFSIWYPKDKILARKQFNLPLDKKIILLGADITRTERKGFNRAIEAIVQLGNDEFIAVVFGNYSGHLPDGFINIGKIKNEHDLNTLYSAADYFLMPSIEEAFGQVTIEALSCGIPVVSFPNGGSLDILKTNKNGVLSTDFTSDALLSALKVALSSDFDLKFIMQDVKDRFNIHDKIDQYIELYENLLK